MSSKLNSFNFGIERVNFLPFVKKISELAKLGDMVKMKFDSDGYTLMYTVNSKNIQSPIHAFKGIIAETNTIVLPKNSVPDTGLDFILLNPKTFVKNVNLFGDEDISGAFKYRPDKKDSHELTISCGKLKLNFTGGDPLLMKDLTRERVEMLIDPSNADFDFNIEKDDLVKIKKLSAASTGVEIVNFYIREGVLSVGDSKWNLELGECKQPNTKLTMNKKHLNSIENMDTVNINVYERFIVVTNDTTLLMISLELDEL